MRRTPSAAGVGHRVNGTVAVHGAHATPLAVAGWGRSRLGRLLRGRRPPRRWAAITLDGAAMAPALPDGCSVLIDCANRGWKPGRIVAARTLQGSADGAAAARRPAVANPGEILRLPARRLHRRLRRRRNPGCGALSRRPAVGHTRSCRRSIWG